MAIAQALVRADRRAGCECATRRACGFLSGEGVMAFTTESQQSASLDALVLKHGSHARRNQGVCLLEAVAWFAGEKHSDRPTCCDVALAAFGRSLNDRMKTDAERAKLRPLIPLLVGTTGSGELAKRRAYLLVDRYLRIDLPYYFRSLPGKPRPDVADKFEALAPVVDAGSAEAARDMARKARDELRLRPLRYDAALRAALTRASAPAAAARYAAPPASPARLRYAHDDDARWKALAKNMLDRAIESFRAAIALTEATA